MTTIPNETADVVVVGLGVHGAAVAAELARRGAVVVGIERSASQHVNGSSHGPMRMVQARGPHGALDGTATAALIDAWSELLHDAGDRGALNRRSAVTLDAAVSDPAKSTHVPLADVDWTARRETPGHLLDSVRAVLALRTLAARRGATLVHDEVVSLTSVLGRHPQHVLVTTTVGTVHARTVLFCLGPQTAMLPPGLRPDGLWLEPALTLIAPVPGHPVHESGSYYLVHRPEGEFCVVPVPGTDLVQAGHFRQLAVTTNLGAEEATARAGRSALTRHLGRQVAGIDTIAGHYTHTASGHFELVRAGHRIGALSACAGMGFKFAPAIATAVSDVLLGDTDTVPGTLRVDYRRADPWS